MPSIVRPPTARVPTAETSNGCFETMRAYEGKIFRLDAHLDRLWASAQFLGLSGTLDRASIRKQLIGALADSTIPEAVVRIALLPHMTGSGRVPQRIMPSIVVVPAYVPSPQAYAQGIRVAVVPTKKFPVSVIDPQTKYSARLGSILAVQDAQLRGVDEALFLDELGTVTESTASNFGIIRDGAIVTAACWQGLLAGITRDVLFELAATLRLPIREMPITRHECYTAQEAFMTSTLKEVLAVTTIDGRTIGSGRPGPVTQRLLQAFRHLVKTELKLKHPVQG